MCYKIELLELCYTYLRMHLKYPQKKLLKAKLNGDSNLGIFDILKVYIKLLY